jgi:hypothetical protein
MAASKLTILLSGMIAADPYQGGATWAVLQYLLGFKRLGHNVYFVEPLEEATLRPASAPLARSANAAYFRRVIADFGLEQTSALLLAGTQQTVGLPYSRLRQVARRADVLINISGMLTDEALTGRIPLRVYLDLDPAFNQLWYAAQGINMRFADHSHFVTIGQTIGRPDCVVPTCGLPWITTLQPVVLAYWPVAERITYDALTTVGNWRGYGSIEYEGVFYGQKAHSLRRFITLPTLTKEKFMLALAIHPDEGKDLAALASNGWHLLDPAQVAYTPASYQQFIQGSKAEFGIAKSGYVAARCGWFSDRSICYLVSGRPAIAQETGFSRFLPTGSGLFAFETSDELLASIEELRRDYARHARAARAIAEEHFDSDKVLARLLQRIGADGRSRPVGASVQAVGTAELRAALEHALSRHFGVQRRIVKLKRRPSPYRSSFELEELDVHLEDDTTLQLMFKNLSRQAMLEGARRAKPAFLYNPLRQIETYRAILAPNRLSTVTCYGAVVDHAVGRYWLFLEKVPGLELYQVGEFVIWQQVARWLAVMHTRFAGESDALMQAVPLLRYDSDFYRLWLRRARAFLRPAKPSQSQSARRRMEWLAGRYDQVVERLVGLPVTFIHGEFYASNVLVQETAGALRVCPVDWELAAVGPGLIDLAAITAGKWTEEEKAALALAYHGVLAQDGGWQPAPDEFLAALDCCRLHLAVQMLGWSPEWLPPPQHAQDWLGEALRLAEKLGL